MDPVTLYSTWPDAESADRCARRLIEARAAACATTLPGARSTYRWEGAIETASETILLVKTTAAAAARAREIIVTQHPYTVPCVTGWALAPTLAHEPYLTWMSQEIDA